MNKEVLNMIEPLKYVNMSAAEISAQLDILDTEATKRVKPSKPLTHRQSIVHRLCLCGDGSGMLEWLDENNLKHATGFRDPVEMEVVLRELVERVVGEQKV